MNKKEETKDYSKLMIDDQNKSISFNNPEAPYIEFGGCDNYLEIDNKQITEEELEYSKDKNFKDWLITRSFSSQSIQEITKEIRKYRKESQNNGPQ